MYRFMRTFLGRWTVFLNRQISEINYYINCTIHSCFWEHLFMGLGNHQNALFFTPWNSYHIIVCQIRPLYFSRCTVYFFLSLVPVKIYVTLNELVLQNKGLPSKDKFTSYTPEQVSVRGMILESQGQSGRGLRYWYHRLKTRLLCKACQCSD